MNKDEVIYDMDVYDERTDTLRHNFQIIETHNRKYKLYVDDEHLFTSDNIIECKGMAYYIEWELKKDTEILYGSTRIEYNQAPLNIYCPVDNRDSLYDVEHFDEDD